MNLGQKLFSPEPRKGETPEQALLRVKETGELFRRVFDNPDGRRLVKLLYSHSHPLRPRFEPGLSTEQAAFLDGERSLIGLIWLNGVSEPTMTTQE